MTSSGSDCPTGNPGFHALTEELKQPLANPPPYSKAPRFRNLSVEFCLHLMAARIVHIGPNHLRRQPMAANTRLEKTSDVA